MIIYQVLPNRAFPFIISSLTGNNLTTKHNLTLNNNIQYFKKSFEFSEIFHLENLNDLEKMYAYQTQVIRFHPNKPIPRKFKEIYHPKYYEFIRYYDRFPEHPYLTESELNEEIQLVHGLFSSDRIKNFKQVKDFSFTFIDNPIDSVYNLYKYTKYVYTHGFEQFKNNYFNSENLIGDTDFEGRNYVHYYEIFHKNSTIELFIDNFINNNMKWIHNFFYFPITIYEEGSGKLSKLYKNHDFYGVVDTKENLIKSIEKFNNFQIFKNLNFKIDLEIFNYYFSSEQKQCNTYRRNDLEKLMEKDLIFFQEKVKSLHGT